MIMRKPPRNDVDTPAGQLLNPVSKAEREEKLKELMEISEELDLYIHFEKPLQKEIADYQEILRRNNSENSR